MFFCTGGGEVAGRMPVGALSHFFTRHCPRGRTLLLGYSGGIDSTALLDALCVVRGRFDFRLVVAHLDHGWREESAVEAADLRLAVEGRGLAWEGKRALPPPSRNREAAARAERLRFFCEASRKHEAHAVLLAHQADDVVETVLKRVLEGASLHKLHGLRPEHQVEGVRLWRPLLEVSREAIERYCRRRRLTWREDSTNCDPRYLRARMRISLIPELERLFGKGIRRPLLQIASRSRVLEASLEREGEGSCGPISECESGCCDPWGS